MAYEKSSYHRKWWVKTIRERNFFGFRYWWFNWSAWILACFLLLYGIFFQTDIDNSSCLDRNNLSRRVSDIDKAMEKCCSCNTPPIPPPPTPPALPPNSIPCNNGMNANGRNEEHHKPYDLGTNSGIVKYCYDTKNIADRVKIIYDGRVIHDSGMISTVTERCFDFNYQYDPNKPRYLDVYVFPSENPGTVWEYNIDCPK